MKKAHRHGTENTASPAVRAERGLDALLRERFKEAVELFKRAIRSEPRPEWKVALADAYRGRARSRGQGHVQRSGDSSREHDGDRSSCVHPAARFSTMISPIRFGPWFNIGVATHCPQAPAAHLLDHGVVSSRAEFVVRRSVIC